MVQLMSKEVSEKCVLSADVGEVDPRHAESYSVTCSLLAEPCARNTLTLRRYQPDHAKGHNTTFLREYDTQELCYGELVLLQVRECGESDESNRVGRGATQGGPWMRHSAHTGRASCSFTRIEIQSRRFATS